MALDVKARRSGASRQQRACNASAGCVTPRPCVSRACQADADGALHALSRLLASTASRSLAPNADRRQQEPVDRRRMRALSPGRKENAHGTGPRRPAARRAAGKHRACRADHARSSLRRTSRRCEIQSSERRSVRRCQCPAWPQRGPASAARSTGRRQPLEAAVRRAGQRCALETASRLSARALRAKFASFAKRERGTTGRLGRMRPSCRLGAGMPQPLKGAGGRRPSSILPPSALRCRTGVDLEACASFVLALARSLASAAGGCCAGPAQAGQASGGSARRAVGVGAARGRARRSVCAAPTAQRSRTAEDERAALTLPLPAERLRSATALLGACAEVASP
jgi:hypothetical protein